jgi:hypothetical protein
VETIGAVVYVPCWSKRRPTGPCGLDKRNNSAGASAEGVCVAFCARGCDVVGTAGVMTGAPGIVPVNTPAVGGSVDVARVLD